MLQPLAGDELDQLHKDVEGHVLGYHAPLTTRKQHLHNHTETPGVGNEREGEREGGRKREGGREGGRKRERERERERESERERARRREREVEKEREKEREREREKERMIGRLVIPVCSAQSDILESGYVALALDTHHVHPGRRKQRHECCMCGLHRYGSNR